MNAINYDRLMMQETARPGERRLLIHACCAPCSSACLERLKDYFDITALFYNPNIEERTSLSAFSAKRVMRAFSTASMTKNCFTGRSRGWNASRRAERDAKPVSG